jgi:hypothetical protein
VMVESLVQGLFGCGQYSPMLDSGNGWIGDIGYMGYIGIMFQAGGSNVVQCIIGEGGKHCIGWAWGSGMMGTNCWGPIGMGLIMGPKSHGYV